MDRDYDIFEKLPDGAVIWHSYVHGLNAARSTLENLARQSKNEFYALHMLTMELAARVNGSKAS